MLRSSGHARVSLFDIEADDLMITGLERSGDEVSLYVLNPDATAHTLRLSSGALVLMSAGTTGLDGMSLHACDVIDGVLALDVPARAWLGLRIQTA